MEFCAVLNRPKTCDHEIHISQTSRWVLYTAGICTTGRFVFRSKLVYDPERNPIQRMPYSFHRVHIYFPTLRTWSNTRPLFLVLTNNTCTIYDITLWCVFYMLNVSFIDTRLSHWNNGWNYLTCKNSAKRMQ